jgi:HAMP domain-containing protein
MREHESASPRDELTQQMHDIALVVTSVANGDLTKKLEFEATGEMLELKKTINAMVDQLNVFAYEATRTSREIGTEGVFGGNMDVKGVTGSWRDLTDNVNYMANKLAVQVRSIKDAVEAVNAGDTSRRITVEAQGEMKELRDAINALIERSVSAA